MLNLYEFYNKISHINFKYITDSVWNEKLSKSKRYKLLLNTYI